jgi:hypothetical protein
MLRIWLRSTIEVGYVTTVAILAIVATAHPNHIAYPAFDLVLALAMPALLAIAPVFYVVVGNAWDLTGADHGGPTWPVTVAYVVMFSAAAVLNVGVVTLVASHLRARYRRRRNACHHVGVRGAR